MWRETLRTRLEEICSLHFQVGIKMASYLMIIMFGMCYMFKPIAFPHLQIERILSQGDCPKLSESAVIAIIHNVSLLAVV